MKTASQIALLLWRYYVVYIVNEVNSHWNGGDNGKILDALKKEQILNETSNTSRLIIAAKFRMLVWNSLIDVK